MNSAYRLLRKTVRSIRGTRHGKPAIIQPSNAPRSFQRYVFIAGLHRSGTTMMEQLLHTHCDVSALRADVPENEGQHLQDVVPAARDFGGPGRFAFEPEMHTEPSEGQLGVQQRERLLQCWTPWMTEGGEVLLEKSPPNLVRIPWLRSLFPGAKFLIMTRDPRVSAAATQKWSGLTIEEMMLHWNAAYSSAYTAMKDDCMVLRYEDMCADLDGSLTRIINAFSLERRDENPVIDPRFGSVQNSNEKYLDMLSPRHYGNGIWDKFGYDLK